MNIFWQLALEIIVLGLLGYAYYSYQKRKLFRLTREQFDWKITELIEHLSHHQEASIKVLRNLLDQFQKEGTYFPSPELKEALKEKSLSEDEVHLISDLLILIQELNHV